MHRINRIGPWPLIDIEVPPWEPNATLRGVIDDVAAPLCGGGVRSVTVPKTTNFETIHLPGLAFANTQATQWALGCLIDGTNEQETDNVIYTISGSLNITIGTQNKYSAFTPIISKLDATPSDPDAVITITDFTILPCLHNTVTNQESIQASVNTQAVVGNIRGSTASQSSLPIFVGWMHNNSIGASYNVRGNMSISVYKYTNDIQTSDPWR